MSRTLSKNHELKTLREFWELIAIGRKTFEIRRNDRDFKVGDRLMLREWDEENQRYTGRWLSRRIKYISDFEQKDGFVVMSLDLDYIKRQ